MKELWEKIKPITEKVKDFFRAPSYTRTLALIGLLILVLALPITVAFLGQQTNTQNHAYFICDAVDKGYHCGSESIVSTDCGAGKFNKQAYVHITEDAGGKCGVN